MSMREYDDLKNLKIPAEQERIMDIICDAWEECRATDCQSECKENKDNVDDREQKGRNIVKVGEEHPCAKLSKKAVKDARWEHAYHGTSFQKLADRYGVSKKAMQNAINGVTWKCVPYMPEPPEVEE